MTFNEAHTALDDLFASAPQYGEIGIFFTIHESRIVRFERTVSEKIASKSGDTEKAASGGDHGICQNSR